MMIAPPIASRPLQRALRTFQYLDLSNVEQFLIELIGIGLEDTVDEHGDRGLAVARCEMPRMVMKELPTFCVSTMVMFGTIATKSRAGCRFPRTESPAR
jgi:hypothetical protein